MKTNFFVEATADSNYSTVAAIIQCANLALFKAVAAKSWELRASTNMEQRRDEVCNYFGISDIPSTSGYEAAPRSTAAAWTSAWVNLVDLAMSSARAGECGKALEKLMTPAIVASKFGNSEPEAIDPAILKLDPDLAKAFAAGAAKSAAERNKRDVAQATEAAKELDSCFRSMRGTAVIDLYPHEVEQLVDRFASQLRDGLVFSLRNGFYSRGGKVDPDKAGELVLAQNALKVAELTKKYLAEHTPADDCVDFDAEDVDHDLLPRIIRQ